MSTSSATLKPLSRNATVTLLWWMALVAAFVSLGSWVFWSRVADAEVERANQRVDDLTRHQQLLAWTAVSYLLEQRKDNGPWLPVNKNDLGMQTHSIRGNLGGPPGPSVYIRHLPGSSGAGLERQIEMVCGQRNLSTRVTRPTFWKDEAATLEMSCQGSTWRLTFMATPK